MSWTLSHRRLAPLLVCLLALLAVLLACTNAGTPGPRLSERATGLAQTAAALLTGTAAASVTPQTATPLPTASPLPSATATLAPPTLTVAPATDTAVPKPTPTDCPKDDSDFVSDVNVPDGTHVVAGGAFSKTWRLRNSGPCTWTTDYTFRSVAGESMGTAGVNLPGPVAPGATVDITVPLIAPASPGSHVSHWQLFSPGGVGFGTKPYVQIKVP